ncbi:hypothetical protein AB0J80_35385 [Actinoplanes sp. NPDC049548]|uniref:hypothetical protein n=1 Tax=Actinoplanes sp. NPDC049548 TaxID=3155152 RepID=UPI0034259429
MWNAALLVAAVVAAGGAAFGYGWVVVVAGAVACAAVGLHPVITDHAVPWLTRVLLRGGLVFVVLALAVDERPWERPAADALGVLVERAEDWRLFGYELCTALAMVVACVCFGEALRRVWRSDMRRHAAVMPAVVGFLLLLVVVVMVADSAWQSFVVPVQSLWPDDEVNYQSSRAVVSGALVAYGDPVGWNREGTAAVVALLGGAAQTVLACARLSTWRPAEPS